MKIKPKRMVKVTKERKINTYTDIWHTSLCLLQKGQEDEKGSYHQFMASLVFTAFSLEACLNHIGPKLFKSWEDLERLGPQQKLNVIGDKLCLNIDYGKMPWQTVKELFGFRNTLAHAKSGEEKVNDIMPLEKFSDKGFGDLIPTTWEKYCTQKNAEKAREDVSEIIIMLYKAGNFKDDNPFFPGFQFSSAEVIGE